MNPNTYRTYEINCRPREFGYPYWLATISFNNATAFTVVGINEQDARHKAAIIARAISINNITEDEERRRGETLARVLRLPENDDGRYNLEGGDKTALGLFRTIQRIMLGEWEEQR